MDIIVERDTQESEWKPGDECVPLSPRGELLPQQFAPYIFRGRKKDGTAIVEGNDGSIYFPATIHRPVKRREWVCLATDGLQVLKPGTVEVSLRVTMKGGESESVLSFGDKYGDVILTALNNAETK